LLLIRIVPALTRPAPFQTRIALRWLAWFSDRPTGVQVAPSEFSGHADVSWAKVRGAKTYIIERAEEVATAEWKVIGFSTKSYATLNSMVSGKKYWFRVCAIGAAGPSAWSNPVAIFAP